jgi:hypothetical protein
MKETRLLKSWYDPTWPYNEPVELRCSVHVVDALVKPYVVTPWINVDYDYGDKENTAH